MSHVCALDTYYSIFEDPYTQLLAVHQISLFSATSSSRTTFISPLVLQLTTKVIFQITHALKHVQVFKHGMTLNR